MCQRSGRMTAPEISCRDARHGGCRYASYPPAAGPPAVDETAAPWINCQAACRDRMARPVGPRSMLPGAGEPDCELDPRRSLEDPTGAKGRNRSSHPPYARPPRRSRCASAPPACLRPGRGSLRSGIGRRAPVRRRAGPSAHRYSATRSAAGESPSPARPRARRIHRPHPRVLKYVHILLCGCLSTFLPRSCLALRQLRSRRWSMTGIPYRTALVVGAGSGSAPPSPAPSRTPG